MAAAKKTTRKASTKKSSKKVAGGGSKKKPTSAKKKSTTKAKAKVTKKAKTKATPAKKTAKKVSSTKKPKTEAAKSASASSDSKKKKSAAEEKRLAFSAAMKETLDSEESTSSADEDEFDPEAFFAASGGQGIFRAHVMRKERVDLSIPVRYRLMKGPLVFSAELINLSKGGLCLVTPKALKLKTAIKIEIPLPHTSELFTVQAECIWSDALEEQKGKKTDTFYTGLRFLQMSLAKQTVINNFIQQRRDEIVLAKIGLDKFTDSVPVAGLD